MKVALNNLYLFYLLWFSATTLASEQYPIEFSDFFIEHEDVIQVTLVGAKEYVSIPSLVTYDSYRLKKDQEVQLNIRNYLKQESLKDKEIDNIIIALNNGIQANPGCKKVLSQCVPEDAPNASEYVFDFDNKVLKIFVSSDMLEQQLMQKKYHSHVNNNQALISTTDVSGYVSDNRSSITLSNEIIAGLKYGYLTTDAQYATANDQFDLYEANYHLEKDNIKGVVGYKKYGNPSLNSVDFLNNGMDLSGYSLTIGSSDNLVVGKNNTLQTLNFFSSTGGRLEVTQNERVLISRNIGAGQHSIGYDELPKGIYDVTITVSQGDIPSVYEIRHVVNSSQFDLAVKDWDYQVQLGYLDTELTYYDLGFDINGHPIKSPEVDDTSRYYARTGATYRLQENLMFGAGLIANNEDTQVQGSVKLALGDWVDGEVTLSQLASGGSAQYASANVSPFFVSYSKSDLDFEKSSLAHLLYGDRSTIEWTVGASSELFGGNAFVNYLSIESEDDFGSYKSESLSASWSKFAFGGTVSLSANYSLSGDYHDDWSTTLMWSLNFNDNTSGRFSTQFSDNGYTETRSSLTHSQQYDLANVSTTAGVTLGENGVRSELSMNANGESSSARYGAYGYLTDDGDYSLSANYSTTQVISSNGVMSTPRKGQSFIGVDPEWNGSNKDKVDSELTYYISNDNGYKRKSSVSGKGAELIQIPNYTETELELDGDMLNVEIEKGSLEGFSLPGTLFVLDSKLTALLTQTFVVSDIDNQPLDQLRCFGPGCKSVERVSDDGVFRVNYREQTPFALVSDKKMCVFDVAAIGSKYVHAYCLPGLENPYEDKANSQIEPSEASDLMLIGRYESNSYSEQLLENLTKVDVEFKVIRVGNTNYIYIPTSSKYTNEQISVVDDLKKYAVYNDAKIDNLFSAR